MFIHININTVLAVPVNTSAVYWTNIKGMYTLVGSFESPGTRICIWLCNVYIYIYIYIYTRDISYQWQTDRYVISIIHLLEIPQSCTKPYTHGTTMITSCNGNILRVTGHLCGNSPVPGEFLAQRPMTRSFGVLFDLRLNQRLSKQSWRWWFETLSRPLWRHCNETCYIAAIVAKVVDHW